MYQYISISYRHLYLGEDFQQQWHCVYSTIDELGVLKGLVGLVTGGASGLGRATAERLIRRGGRVVIADLPSSAGEEVADSLGKDCKFTPTDVTSPSDVKRSLAKVQSSFGRLDAVINCAGIYEVSKTYNFRRDEAHSLELFSKILHINTIGSFNVIRLAAGLMAKNKPRNDDGEKGVIVNAASVAAFDGQKGLVAYSASKAAIAGMTLPLAMDLASQGIRVCAVAPGIFATPMSGDAQEMNEFCAKVVPFPKRIGTADEFAYLVEHILTNPMMNGEVVRLDGGARFTGDFGNIRVKPYKS